MILFFDVKFISKKKNYIYILLNKQIFDKCSDYQHAHSLVAVLNLKKSCFLKIFYSCFSQFLHILTVVICMGDAYVLENVKDDRF